ncbi:MAG: hypothetical protein Fur005_00070 [Roseiflexaceae bacterium]
MTHEGFTFNVWDDPWIRVVYPDGSRSLEGIGTVLAAAHSISALADPSPLVVAGTHRLLAAIVQAIVQPHDLDDLEAIYRAGTLDQTKLDAFASQYRERFELFHPTMPFLQTGDVPVDGGTKPAKGQRNPWADPKPISSLFSELPTETARIHYQHSTDTSHSLCPACCARGLVTIPAFASSGGAGIRPSINGVPPFYVLPVGATLFESLVWSLMTPAYQPPSADQNLADQAIWNGPPTIAKNHQVSRVSYLESLLFPARRMRLFPKYESRHCTHCGKHAAYTVSQLLFEMGHWANEQIGTWEDPFAAYRLPKGAKATETEVRPIRPEAGKACWREYTGLLLVERDDLIRPRVVRQIAALIDRGVLPTTHPLQFRTIGLLTDGKAKIFEWLDESLDAPPALLNDPIAATLVHDALQLAQEGEDILSSTFDRHFRPSRSKAGKIEAKLTRFKTIRSRMLATFWETLAPIFRQLIARLADSAQHDTALRAWATAVTRCGRTTFDESAALVGERAEEMQARVEATAECRRRFASKQADFVRTQGLEQEEHV